MTTPQGLQRQKAVMELLLREGSTLNCQRVADETGMRYSQAYVALHQLMERGQVEKLRGDALMRLHHCDDGRVVNLGPPAGAVGFRAAVLVDAAAVADLEALYASPSYKGEDA